MTFLECSLNIPGIFLNVTKDRTFVNDANVMFLRLQICLQHMNDTYVQHRLTLLLPSLSTYCLQLENVGLLQAIRGGGAYMIHVCIMEFQLALKLFGPDAIQYGLLSEEESSEKDMEASSEFQRFIFQLSSDYYNTIRQLVFSTSNDDMQCLCEAISVLRHEILEDQIKTQNVGTIALSPVFERMIEDTQERLVYTTQVYIRDTIEGYEPIGFDLDYPDKLEKAIQSGDVYSTWYPTLESTLFVLSSIYRVLNTKIFEAIAQDVLHLCTTSLLYASDEITRKKGKMDGILFLVKHLLTLREQVTPFEIGTSVQEMSLDFSSTTGTLFDELIN